MVAGQRSIAWVFTTSRFAGGIITAIIGAKVIQRIASAGYSIWAQIATGYYNRIGATGITKTGYSGRASGLLRQADSRAVS